jgi:hypothetical protein
MLHMHNALSGTASPPANLVGGSLHVTGNPSQNPMHRKAGTVRGYPFTTNSSTLLAAVAAASAAQQQADKNNSIARRASNSRTKRPQALNYDDSSMTRMVTYLESMGVDWASYIQQRSAVHTAAAIPAPAPSAGNSKDTDLKGSRDTIVQDGKASLGSGSGNAIRDNVGAAAVGAGPVGGNSVFKAMRGYKRVRRKVPVITLFCLKSSRMRADFFFFPPLAQK